MVNKFTLLTTGANGLVGSKLISDFKHKYNFDNLDRLDKKEPVDILDIDSVLRKVEKSKAKFLIHFAAFTDVTKAWEQKNDKDGPAYQVNVIGTQNIIKACEKFNKHLIHISTAYVFDGQKQGLYTEDDQPNPIEWYGQTKLLAEELVLNSDLKYTILRIDQPFRSDNFSKLDIAHKIILGLKNNNLYPQFIDHFFGPTFIDDFVKVIDWVVRTDTTGLYHASSGEKFSDYQFASLINKQLNLNKIIKQNNLNNYLKTLNRPYQQNTAMSCEKLKSKLDFKLKSIQDAVSQLAFDFS